MIKQLYSIIRAIFPWVALFNGILILSVIISHFIAAQFAPLSILKTLSYFTIQTNLISGLWEIGIFISWWRKKPMNNLKSPILMNILFINNFVTLTVYFLFLSSLDYSQFPQFNPFWDLIYMHYLTPLIYFVGYFSLISSHTKKTIHYFYWLIYPFIYYIYSYIYLWIYSEYIYPFLDVSSMGGILNHLAFVLMVTIFIVIIGEFLDFFQRYRATKK